MEVYICALLWPRVFPKCIFVLQLPLLIIQLLTFGRRVAVDCGAAEVGVAVGFRKLDLFVEMCRKTSISRRRIFTHPSSCYIIFQTLGKFSHRRAFRKLALSRSKEKGQI